MKYATTHVMVKVLTVLYIRRKAKKSQIVTATGCKRHIIEDALNFLLNHRLIRMEKELSDIIYYSLERKR